MSSSVIAKPTHYQRTGKAATRRCYVFLNNWLAQSSMKGKHIKNDRLAAWISTLRGNCFRAYYWQEMLNLCEESIVKITDPDLKDQVETVYETMLEQCELRGK